MLKSTTNLRARRAAGYAIVLLGLVFLFPQVALAQCAMCRRALQSPEGQQMIAALRGGIVFLLIAPFAVFATIAMLAVRAERRHGPRGALGCRNPAARRHFDRGLPKNFVTEEELRTSQPVSAAVCSRHTRVSPIASDTDCNVRPGTDTRRPP